MQETAIVPAGKDLEYYEAVIEGGLQTFVLVGGALMEIRDQQLYKNSYSNFETYCIERWGFARSHAYRLMNAAEVVRQLSPIGDSLPENEAQARVLVSIPEAARAITWQTIKESAPDGKVTARHAKAVAVVIENALQTGALDPGDGIMIPFSEVIHAAITSEEFETMQRQKQHIADKLAPLMSSASNEWYTTQDIIQAAIDVMGGIDLDPCSNSHDNPNVPARYHYTKEDDGLAQKWQGRVYMNPPYGRDIVNWMVKLVEEFKAGRVTEAIVLAPARPDPEWFRVLRDFPRCFMSKRVKFNNNPNSAPFPTMLVSVGCDRNRFIKIMSPMGDIYERVES